MKVYLLIPILVSWGLFAGTMEAWDKDVGKPAPELIPSAWLGTPVDLDHVRGNTIILAFWNADNNYYGGPADAFASLLKDYEKFGKMLGVTFIGVCFSPVATPKSMADQAKRYKLEPFANMLDTCGATAMLYNVPRTSTFRLVVVDGEGKIAYNAGKGWHWTSGEDAGRYIHHTQLEKSMKKYKGILGVDEVPTPMLKAAHYFDLQQFTLMENEILRVTATDKSGPVAAFAAHLRKKFDVHRQSRLTQIADLSRTKPVQAYREAMSFMQAFPKAEERTTVNEMYQKLLAEPAVKKELDAETAFQRMLVPEMRKITTTKQYETRIAPLLAGYQKQFAGTDFVLAAVNACEGLQEGVNSR